MICATCGHEVVRSGLSTSGWVHAFGSGSGGTHSIRPTTHPPESESVMPRSLDRAVEIEAARRAIREQAPFDVKRETRWQYEERLATAARDAVAGVHEHRAGSTDRQVEL